MQQREGSRRDPVDLPLPRLVVIERVTQQVPHSGGRKSAA
jgi:hypothetical protein